MLDLDNWQEIWASLRRNKGRTLLTAFGVFWGILLLVVMLGSGNGFQAGVEAGFGDSATNSFFLWTQRTSKAFRGLPPGRSPELDNADVAAIRDQVPEAAVVAPRNQLGGHRGGTAVIRGKRSGGFSVMGDYPQILAIQSVRLTAGRFLNDLDIAERRKVAVIGSRVQEVLFEPGEDPVGDSIEVNGVYFKVVGTFRSTQPGNRGDRDAQTVYLPFTTFQTAFNYGDRVGWLAVTSVPEVPATRVEERVRALLAERHKVAPDDRRAFGSFNLEEEYNRAEGLFGGISMLVWIVGIGTLAAGVIGVSNIMLIIVKERTREIGLKRAIGASPLSVVGQIVLESVALTAVAGYFGLLAGVALVEGGRWLLAQGGGTPMFSDPSVSLTDALRALLVLVVAGVAAGLIPARRAVAISPVEALRSE